MVVDTTLVRISPVSPALFRVALSSARWVSDLVAGATSKPEEMPDRATYYLSSDLESGFGVDSDGTLIGVFSLKRGRGDFRCSTLCCSGERTDSTASTDTCPSCTPGMGSWRRIVSPTGARATLTSSSCAWCQSEAGRSGGDSPGDRCVDVRRPLRRGHQDRSQVRDDPLRPLGATASLPCVAADGGDVMRQTQTVKREVRRPSAPLDLRTPTGRPLPY